MFSVISLDKVVNYKSPNDPDKSNPTTFRLGVLDPLLKCHIEDITTNIKGEGEIQLDLAFRNYLTVQFGLRDIVGLLNEQGNQVEIKKSTVYIRGRGYDIISDDTLKLLPKELFRELSEQINSLSELSDKEKKI